MKADLLSQYSKRLAELSSHPVADKSALDTQIAIFTAECELKMKELTDSYNESSKLLLTSYETYLKDVIPPKPFLPVTVSITVPSKNIVFKKYVIKPVDSAHDVKAFLLSKLKETGNPVVEFSKENYFVVKR